MLSVEEVGMILVNAGLFARKEFRDYTRTGFSVSKNGNKIGIAFRSMPDGAVLSSIAWNAMKMSGFKPVLMSDGRTLTVTA